MSVGAHPILSLSVSQLAEKQRKDIDDPSLFEDIKSQVLSLFVPNCFESKPTSHIIAGDHTIFRSNGRLSAILNPGKQSADHWKRMMEPGSVKSSGLQSLLPQANGLTSNDVGNDNMEFEELVETGSIKTAVKSSLAPIPSPTFGTETSSSDDDDDDDDDDSDVDQDSDEEDDDDDDSSLAKFVVGDDEESGSDGEFAPSSDDEEDDDDDDEEDEDDDEVASDDDAVASKPGTSFHPHTTHADVPMDDASSSSDSDLTPPPSPKKIKKPASPKKKVAKAPPKVVLKDFLPIPDDCKAAFVRLATRTTDAKNPTHMSDYNKHQGPQRQSLAMVRSIQNDSTAFPKLMKALNLVVTGHRVSLYDPEPGHKVCELTDAPSTQIVKASLYNRNDEWVHKHVGRDVGMLLFMADAAIYASTLLCEPSPDDEVEQLAEHVADFYWKSYQFLQAYHEAIQTR